jgi:glyoxylase-like metal-dependent hydrolase (beta-lactamase superfamily II)
MAVGDHAQDMNARGPVTVSPILVADLHVEGERMPVYVHLIDHPDARVLVDTGMTELCLWLRRLEASWA